MSAPRRHIMLGTAGHVDHGKTALVKLLTGCDTDTLAEEKQRGLTIEVGFAPCRMADERIVGIVDVPGHVHFIRNMVAGAHGVDVVILVVAADDSVMPQTREHLDILTLLGVRLGLVALTKIDMVDPQRREQAAAEVRQLIRGTFLADAPICPISNVTGEGFEDFFVALGDLVQCCEPRRSDGLFRMWIDRAFTIKGFGTVASGIPAAGQVRIGDRLTWWPGGDKARVRRLEVYGQEDQVGHTGECVALNLADVQRVDLNRGGVLCAGSSTWPVSMVEGQLTLLPQISRPLQDQAEVHLHAGTARVMARLALLEGEQLEPGDRMLVQLRLVEPLALTAGDRFVVRAPMAGMADGQVTTLGGGRIVGTSDRRIRRRQKDLVQRLRRRAAVIEDPLQWCAAHLDECDDAIELPPLAERAGLTVEQCTEALDQLKGSGHAIVLSDGYRVHRDVIDRRASQLMKMLADHHAAEPARLGMQEDAARNTMRVHGELFDRIVAEVVERGDVVRKGLILALARHQPQVNTEDAALCRQIESLYRRQGYETARLEELPAQLGQDRSRIAAMAQLLIDGGVLVELDDQIIMHQMHVHQAEKVIRDLFKQAEDFTTAEFRDALGASRKYAIPLLDYFDRRRVTVRHGNRRSAGALGGGNATK